MPKLYRSISFSQQTSWSHPLKKVEVAEQDESFEIYIYDVGHQPPFVDVHRIPSTALAFSNPQDINDMEDYLEGKNIYVNEWRRVEKPFMYECNAVMRPDIRADVRSIYGFEGSLPPVINSTTATNAIKSLSEYSGQSPKVSVLFSQNKAEADDLLSYSTSGYLMFKTPENYNHWGFVVKGNADRISILLKVEEDFECLLYDQNLRQEIVEGKILETKIESLMSGESYRLTSNGLEDNFEQGT